MTEFSNPKSIEELATSYVVDDLPEDAEEFKQLLANNPQLVKEVNRLHEVVEQVICGLNEVEPPPHLRSAILTEASRSTKHIWIPKLSTLPWNKIIGSVAALLVLCLGIDNYRLRQDLRLATNINNLLEQSQTRLFSLTGVNVADAASGSFVVNLAQQKGIIAIQNLPAPPVGKVYRLWAIVDGDKIPCGQLSINRHGKVLENFSMPADFYDNEISGLLITLELPQSARYPVGTVVMKSTL